MERLLTLRLQRGGRVVAAWETNVKARNGRESRESVAPVRA